MVDEPDRLALRLADFLERLAAGQDLDSVLADAGDDTQMRQLVWLGHQLVLSAPSRPRPAFRADLQVLLQRQLARQAPARSPLRRRWVLRLASFALAVVLTATGALVVSADSVPGQPLYAFKLLGERTQLALTRDPASRARLQLKHADQRLEETRRILESGATLPASLLAGLVLSGQDAWQMAEASGDGALQATVRSEVAELGHTLTYLSRQAVVADRALLTRAAAELTALVRPTAVPIRQPTPSVPMAATAWVPTPSRTTTMTATSAPPVGRVPTGASATSTQEIPAPATAPPRPGASATVAPTAIPETVAPTVPPTIERPVGTSAASVGARATELARETERAARPTPTPRRWPWWPSPMPPTASPTVRTDEVRPTTTPPPTAGSGAGQEPSPTVTSGSGCCAPTASPLPPPPSPGVPLEP